jgi:hypothetical protein
VAETFEKDPNARLDFAVSWTDWLGTDTISTSTWTADAGITIESTPAPSLDGAKTVVWLSGGTAGQSYQVTNRITTAAGRTDDRSLWIRVRER